MSNTTKNLSLNLLSGLEKVNKDTFNDIIEDIDSKCVGIHHLHENSHWRLWEKDTDYVKGDIVRTTTCKSNQYFQCIVGGTSGKNEPKNQGTGAQITDNTATWVINEIGSSGGNNGASVFIGSKYYTRGQLAIYNGVLYRSIKDHIAEQTFQLDIANWQKLYSNIREWTDSTFYFSNEIVINDNKLYKCKQDHVSAGTFVSDINSWDSLSSNGIETFKSSTYYNDGAIIVEGNRLYRCTLAHTSTTDLISDIENWELINLDIEDWVASTNYYVGQYVSYNGTLYRCITANSDSTWTGSNWKKVSGGGIDNWVTGSSYSVDDLVIYADKLWQCTTAHTSTTFSADEANWKEISSYTIHIDDWAESTAYKAGDLVAYDAQIYRCKVSHTSSSAFITDDTKWEILSPTINIIKDWAVSTAYTLGQFVTHNNVLYKCNTAHTSDSTSFDTDIAKWDKIGSSIDQWKSNTPYRINDLVIYANKLYSCDINHTSASAIDLSKWTLIGDEGIKDWESSKAYKAGQLVLHNNVLYRIHDDYTSSAQITSDDSHLDFVWSNIRPWEPNTYYKVGSIVYNGGCVYKCNNSHTSGSSFTGTVVFDDSSGIFNYSYPTSPPTSNNIGVLDLGSVCQIYKIYFEMHVDKHKWRKLDMYISDDNSTYNLFTTFTSPYTGNKIEKHTVYPQSSTSGRYVKLVASDFTFVGNTPRSFSINPVRVYTSNNNWELISGLSNWKPSIEYSKGDLVIYNSSIYRCISSNSDNTFVPSNWEEMTAFTMWSTGKDYSVGNIVLYNDRIYRCIASHTSSSFSSDRNNWVEISPTSLQNWQASITYPVDSIVLYDNSTGISHWAGNTSYVLNDKVVYDGRIYECSVANSDSDFTASNWHQIATAQVNIYKCITENNDANFTPSKWLAISSIGLASIEDIEAMF